MHFVALGLRMLGTFWKHFGFQWASDGAQMGPWMHMDTKIRAEVDKMANLGAIWSQLGPFWVQLGLQLRGPREILGGPPSHPGGSCLALGAKMASRPPKRPSKTDF